MRRLGCTSVIVQNRIKKKNCPDTFVPLLVLLNDAQKSIVAGGNGVARVDEIRDACLKWITEHAPHVLANDIEALCAKWNIKIIWTPPNTPEFSPIEKVWAIVKLYAAIKFDGSRSIDGLRLDLLEGFYKDLFANEFSGNVRGGSFVSDAAGKCPSAEKLINHCLYNAKADGVQVAINNDPDLKVSPDTRVGHLSGIKEEFLALARKAVNRKVLHHLILEERRRLVGMEVAGAELEDLEDDENEDEKDD
jgi:hypothetical protein